MYQTDFICTYKNIDDLDDQEDLYRIQLLQAFGIEAWDDATVNGITEDLFEKMSPVDGIKEIIVKCRKFPAHTMFVGMMGTDDMTVFRLLFKFELFDLMHRCIVEHQTTGTISNDALAQLANNL